MHASVWHLLYRFLLYPTFLTALRAGAVFSPKIREGLAARKRGERIVRNVADRTGPRVHVHASSVGEFEQARPVIETIRKRLPSARITASFFSPSGFRQQANDEALDEVHYLPLDRTHDVSAFLDRISPELIIVVRYDLWPTFSREVSRRGIPIVLICGVLRRNSLRFLPIVRGLFSQSYSRLSLIHCVSEADADSFRQLASGVPLEVSGDTRYDRVLERAAQDHRSALPITREQLGGGPVLVAGSTWPADERLIREAAAGLGLGLVIVPHEPTPVHVKELRNRFPASVVAGELTAGSDTATDRVVIVDRTGLLLALYSLADLAYVGGAHGAGVHSVLEPAAYGTPVISGPRIDRSRDASEMREHDLLLVTRNVAELRSAFVRLLDPAERRARGNAIAAFVAMRAGATQRILASLEQRDMIRATPTWTRPHD